MVCSSSASTSPIFSIKATNFEAGLESECSLRNTAHDEVFLEGSVGFFEIPVLAAWYHAFESKNGRLGDPALPSLRTNSFHVKHFHPKFPESPR